MKSLLTFICLCFLNVTNAQEKIIQPYNQSIIISGGAALFFYTFKESKYVSPLKYNKLGSGYNINIKAEYCKKIKDTKYFYKFGIGYEERNMILRRGGGFSFFNYNKEIFLYIPQNNDTVRIFEVDLKQNIIKIPIAAFYKIKITKKTDLELGINLTNYFTVANHCNINTQNSAFPQASNASINEATQTYKSLSNKYNISLSPIISFVTNKNSNYVFNINVGFYTQYLRPWYKGLTNLPSAFQFGLGVKYNIAD